MLRRLFLTVIFAQLIQSAAAQGDEPSIQPLVLGVPLEEAITDAASFDWWEIDLNQGDQLRVIMGAADGLAPLIGIIDQTGTLLARSDDGVVNGTVQLDYVAAETRPYRVIATRVGTTEGSTTGSYTLRADIIGSTAPDERYGVVTFRCNDFEATALSSIRFEQESIGAFYTLRIYALDGLQPLIYVQTEREGDLEPCLDSSERTGFNLSMTDGEEYAPDQVSVAGLNIDAGTEFGLITITFGAEAETFGRYIAVIEGFAIDPADNIDHFEVRNAPLPARDHPLDVYMIRADGSSRLDPVITHADTFVRCDDAARRGCETVPSIENIGIRYNDGAQVIGGRFDAGMRLDVGNLDLTPLELSSRDGRTSGAYAIVLIGAIGQK
jgi:hypothetical protein